MSESGSGNPVDSSTDNDKDSSVRCVGCGESCASNSSLRRHMRRCCPDEMNDCPTCGELYKSETGVKQHHVRTHGESLCFEEFECDNCGTVFEERDSERRHDGTFCTHECYIDHYREDWFLDATHVEFNCYNCGKECKKELRELNESSKRKFCTHSCYLNWQSSYDNPLYRGGGNINYGGYWESLREKILERDSYTCQGCKTHKDDLDTVIDVHHIIPIEDFESHEDANYLLNLVALCRSCHRRWEGIPLRPI